MSKILVTGAGGYIGSITADLLLKNKFQVVGVDNFSRGFKEPLKHLENKYGKDQFNWEELDLVTGDLDQFLANNKVDAILHFAALANVGESWDKPEVYFGNNVVGIQRLAESAMKVGVKKFVFSSSCTVYGNAQYVPIDEKHPLAEPVSPYGASKKMCEEIIEWYGRLEKLDYIFLRYFNVTGASDDCQLGDSKKPSFHLIQNAIRGALGIDKFELNYATVKTPDGSPIRDYCNVVDLALAHKLSLDYLLAGKGKNEVFNLGTGEGNSVLEIVKLVKEKTGVDFGSDMAKERRKGEADKMIADIRTAGKILGWYPTHTLEDSINTLIKWYKEHPQGWVE